jgi:hypothetical protein
MNVNNPTMKSIPKPPSLMASLVGGFDSVTSHIYLIVFPVILDLFFWLGPHLRLTNIIHYFINQLEIGSSDALKNSTPDMVEMMKVTRSVWELIAERANLFTALRTYPVGVASLMAGRMSIDSPLGKSNGIEATFGNFFGFWLVLTIVGLLLGTLYFSFTAQAASGSSVTWIQNLKDLPFIFLQVLWLTVLLAILFMTLSIPILIIFSIIILVVGSFGQWIVLLLTGLLLWLLLPLVFTFHGIFINRLKVFPSLWRGIRFAQFTLPQTSLFILIAIVISQGLDLLWQIPPENSWMSLIGIFGHAFVFTGLLSASFIYYQLGDKWVQEVLNLRGISRSESGTQTT